MVFRVGDNRPEKCDIRIVAGINRNLEEMIDHRTTFFCLEKDQNPMPSGATQNAMVEPE